MLPSPGVSLLTIYKKPTAASTLEVSCVAQGGSPRQRRPLRWCIEAKSGRFFAPHSNCNSFNTSAGHPLRRRLDAAGRGTDHHRHFGRRGFLLRVLHQPQNDTVSQETGARHGLWHVLRADHHAWAGLCAGPGTVQARTRHDHGLEVRSGAICRALSVGGAMYFSLTAATTSDMRCPLAPSPAQVCRVHRFCTAQRKDSAALAAQRPSHDHRQSQRNHGRRRLWHVRDVPRDCPRCHGQGVRHSRGGPRRPQGSRGLCGCSHDTVRVAVPSAAAGRPSHVHSDTCPRPLLFPP